MLNKIYTLHCVAFPCSCTVWRVRLHLRLPFTLHLQYIVWYCLLFTHAIICYNYDNVWKSRIKNPDAFHVYELYKYWMSIPFFQAQDVGSRLAAIRRTGRVETRSWPILSHVRLFGFGKHRTLSLELELSRAFVNSVGKNARNRDGGTWNGHMTRWSDVSPSMTPTSLSAAFTRQELARSLVSDNGWGNAL